MPRQPCLRAGVALACALLALLHCAVAAADEQVGEPAQPPSAPAGPSEAVYRVEGAAGDGRTLDTAAIQAAIDACGNAAAGGVVVLEDDKQYLVGTLRLASGVRLHVPANATLLASLQRSHYQALGGDDWYLLLLHKCARCSVEGQGRVDGRGAAWGQPGGGDAAAAQPCDGSRPCGPKLIGVVEASQVDVRGLQVVSAPRAAVEVARSDSVALMGLNVSAGQGAGVVVDGSKHVYVGWSTVEAAGDALAIQASAVGQPTSFLFADGLQLASRGAAVAIGAAARADISSLVLQNLAILPSRRRQPPVFKRTQRGGRGLAIQLRDEGHVAAVQVTNVTMEVQFRDGDGPGGAEPIYVTALPRTTLTKVGTVRNVAFVNVSARAEAGAVIAGSEESTIDGLSLERVRLELQRVTALPGGTRDLRPGLRGVVRDVPTPAVFVEWANHVHLADMEVVWGAPARPEWGQAVEVTPRTVHSLSVQGLTVHDESAHPRTDAPAAAGGAAFGVLAARVLDWAHGVRANLRAGRSAFLSMRENAAAGVQGQRAASSASTVLVAATAVVFGALLLFKCSRAARAAPDGRTTHAKAQV